MDEDATGADIGLGQVNLDPGTGLDPGTVVRAIPTAATSVFPENSSQITVPLSVTALPRGADQQTIAPQPGQAVNLAPPNPVKETSTLAQAAPVVPPGSIAPQVQTATGDQPDKPPEQYGPFGQRVIAAPPGQQTTPGLGQGFLGTTKTMVAPYDRDQNPLITARQNLTAQADALEARARHPYNQMMNHDSAEQWLKDATEMRLKAADIDNKIQAQKDNQAKADNMGVPRANQSMTQTDQSSLEATVKRMRDGDYNAMEALNARGYTAITKAYEGDMLTAMETKLKTGMQVKTLLDSAHSDASYNSIKNQLETNKNHPLANSGFDIPKTLGEWQAQRAQRDRTGREGLLAIDRLKTQQAAQVNFVPEPNKEVAEQQVKNYVMSNGEQLPGVRATNRNGVRGGTDVVGSSDMSKFGADKNVEGAWNNYGPKEAETIGKEIKEAYPATEREKAVNLKRALTLATTDPKTGKPLTDEQTKHLINTNPSVQSVLTEGITAAARGGAGGTNGQLIKLELAKRGPVQKGLDDLIGAFAGGKGVLTGKEGQYLSKLTQGQMRYVIDFLKEYNDKDVSTRLSGAAEHLGKYGGRLDQSGLEPELQDALKAAHDYGRDSEKLHRSSLPAVVDSVSKTRTYLDNTQAGRSAYGATVNPLPPSLLPGLYPELTVNPNAAPPAPAAQQPPASGVRQPPPAAPPPAAGGGALVRTPYNPRLGQYGTPVAPAAVAAAPAAPTATGNVFGGGAAPVPFTPGGPPAVPVNAPAGGGIRPLAATPAASLIQTLAPRAAPPVQTAQANLPASWGVSTANVPAAAPAAPAPQPQRSVPTPQQPGGPGTANVAPPAVVAPAGRSPGGTFNAGVPSNGFPAKIVNNPAARTVYGVAGQTALNVSNNPTIANNSAIVTASSAASESGYRPDEIHDGGIGQGLFGHNRERLSALQQFAGVPVTGKPGAPIPANVQAAFYTREMSKAADADPFIARVLSNPNASAEDLTRVQVRMEKPQGYTGPGSEEKASGWSNRLASTRELMGQSAGGGDGGGGAVASAPAAAMPYPNPKNRDEALANYNAGQRQSPDEAAAYQQRKNELANQATRSGAAMAKPILTTAGAIGGTAVGGPVGGAGGALAGGTLGGALENYLTGENPSDPRSYVVPMAKGAAESIPAMIPGGGALPVAARIATSGAIPAIEKYAETGDAGEAAWSGLMGAAGGATGEAVGRGLGMAGHKLWGGYSTATKAELMSVGQTLADKPAKVMDTSGKMIDNPLWVNAAARAKELGQDPDALAYAVKTANLPKGQVPTKAEAVVARPGAVEAAKVGREFDDIRTQINEAPKPSAANAPTLQHDPTSIVGNGKAVPPKFMADAKTAKGTMLTGSTGQPPKNWGEVWQNQVDARSGLLQKEREAKTTLGAGKQEAVDAYRTMADKVREQQQHIAETMLPPDQAKALMDHLKVSDERYRKAMLAGGPDIAHTIAQGGARGREAQAAFNELAQNDVGAKRMMAALIKLHEAKAAGHSIAGTGGMIGSLTLIPGVGHYAATGLGMVKGWQMLLRYSALRGAGSPVKFSDLVKQEMSKKALAQSGRAGAILGAATAQGVDNSVSDGASQ